MERTFRAQKMLDRVKKEGRENLLDEETVAFIKSLDGKTGSDYNWASVVKNETLVWIPPEETGYKEGTYVALCDCD